MVKHPMTQVLQVGPLMPELAEQLKDHYQAETLEQATPQAWSRLTQRWDGRKAIRAIVTSGRSSVPRWLMEELPALELIANFGVGYDNIDVEDARELDVAVSNTPDVLTECVADAAVGLVLATLRRLPQADAFLRHRRWTEAQGFPLTTKVSGKRFGVLGLGKIGSATAHRLAGFSSTIGYHNRNPHHDVPYTYHPTLEGLAEASDVLIITAPGGASSQGIVDRQALRVLGPEGFLINVGRGSIVREDDLIAALEAGELGGAGLDAFAHEPAVPERLRKRDDVVLLPQIASGTRETRAAMKDLTLENLEQFLSRGELVTPVGL